MILYFIISIIYSRDSGDYMYKYCLTMSVLLINFSLLANTNEKYLGTFTIDNYPIDSCKVKKIGSLFSITESGYSGQKKSFKTKGYLNAIDDYVLRETIENKAIKNGFNAILGYKYYVNGAFDTFDMSTKNGFISFAILISTLDSRHAT